MTAWRIPLSDLNYDEAEEQAVAEVLRSRWLSMGPRTEEFEARMAQYLGVRHAIAVANGTCALELACLRALDGAALRKNAAHARAVALVPDVTFVATANAALAAGASVELVDIATPSKPVLSLEATRRQLGHFAEQGVRLMILPVHYAGFDAGVDQLCEVAKDFGAVVVEDAAHAIGGRSRSGKMLGACGDLGCFSFFANKNLATGEGGLVATDDDDAAAEIRLLRSHGMTSLTWKRHSTRSHGYDVLAAGHNYRITEITAALGLVQLGKLEQGNSRRRRLYKLYCRAFAEQERLEIPFARDGDDVLDRSSCHIFPLLCRTTALRDRVRAALTEAGVQTSHHYPPLHSFTFYGAGATPPRHGFSREFAEREITLPLHPGLTDAQLEEIVHVVLQVLEQA